MGLLDETILTFEPRGARVHLSQSADSGAYQKISIDAQLERPWRLKRPDGAALNIQDCLFNVTASQSDVEPTRTRGGIGVLHFLSRPSPESGKVANECQADVAVSREVLVSLFQALRAGWLPDYMSLVVTGLEHAEIDTQQWDVERDRHLIIRDISIRIPGRTEREGNQQPEEVSQSVLVLDRLLGWVKLGVLIVTAAAVLLVANMYR